MNRELNDFLYSTHGENHTYRPKHEHKSDLWLLSQIYLAFVYSYLQNSGWNLFI